jgi:hypothetical protein
VQHKLQRPSPAISNQINQNVGLGQTIGGYEMNGGSGQFIYNFNKSITVVADAGAVYKPNARVVNVEKYSRT